jgi:hypothetical protein
LPSTSKTVLRWHRADAFQIEGLRPDRIERENRDREPRRDQQTGQERAANASRGACALLAVPDFFRFVAVRAKSFIGDASGER